MQIKVNLKIFIFIILFIITRQIQIYGILMLFALIHEIGHLIAGIIFGFKPQALTINPMGLSISFKTKIEDINTKLKKADMLTLKKIFIALAGPITNFIIAIIYINIDSEIFGISRETIIYSNILIGFFNLIPIYPLDGGRILKCLLHITLGFEKSEKYIKTISFATVIIITVIISLSILYLKNIALLILALYLWILVLV